MRKFGLALVCILATFSVLPMQLLRIDEQRILEKSKHFQERITSCTYKERILFVSAALVVGGGAAYFLYRNVFVPNAQHSASEKIPTEQELQLRAWHADVQIKEDLRTVRGHIS